MNKNKAGIILIISMVIYIVSYPFHKTFIGGVIYYGSSAALIGGLADWWGIKKLLRKTIPKNKEKIFDGLSNMVSEELLTKENLKQLLNNYDTSKLVIEIVKNNDEFENIKTVAKELIIENINKIDMSETKKITSDLVLNNLKKFELNKIVFSVVENSIRSGHDNKIYRFIIKEMKAFCETDYFKKLVIQIIDRIKLSYEGDNVLKKFIDDMTVNEDEIFDKIKLFIDDLENEDNIYRLKFKKWINEKVVILKNSEEIISKIEDWKIEQLNNIDMEKYINIIISNSIGSNGIIHNKVNFAEKLVSIIKNNLDTYIETLSNNTHEQLKADIFIKNSLNKLIDNGHEKVGKMVKENLNKYNDDMLINLIESHVGNDLQLIRINGSLVGAVAGIIMFVIKYVAGV